MKKTTLSFITASILSVSAALCSCSNHNVQKKQEIETSKKEEKEDKKTTDIKNILSDEGIIDVVGIYYAYDENNEIITYYREENPVENKRDFQGKFLNIENILIDENNSNEKVTVLFNANIESDYYRITEPQKIKAVFNKNDDHSLSFESAVIAEDSTPLIEPVYEFDPNYLLEKNYEIHFGIPANQCPDPSKYEYEGFTIEKNTALGKHTNGVYLFDFVASNNTVEKIEIIPGIKNSSLRMEAARIRLTLKNGIVISSKNDISYNPKRKHDKENINGKDLWNTDFSKSSFSYKIEKF